ncbi:MAG: hypothetical protein ACREMY_07020, partial [bacterium]
CDLSVTALEKDALINVSRESRLVDARGNETKTSFLSFFAGDSDPRQVRVGSLLLTTSDDGTLELVRGVARTGHLRFEGVEVTGDQVPLIEVRFGGIHGFDFLREARNWVRDGHTQFRNVRVK